MGSASWFATGKRRSTLRGFVLRRKNAEIITFISLRLIAASKQIAATSITLVSTAKTASRLLAAETPSSTSTEKTAIAIILE